MALPERIPVFFLSGFLGSGKSTLLNALLQAPEFHDTAVIINEFGDVPVDHLLVRHGDTAISQVSTGCLCCSGSTDLRTTLFDLHCAASGGLTHGFSRVIVEMSGLGDPAPLVNALALTGIGADTLRDRTVDRVFHAAGFVTLYDIITGDISIENHFEALKQVAFADTIVLTKTDLARDPATLAEVANLPETLRTLNASAEIIDRQQADLRELFTPRPYSAIERGEDVVGWLALEAALASEAANSAERQPHTGETVNRHGPGIHTFSIVRSEPLPEKRLRQFLAVLQNAAGPRLLRVKGIAATESNPEQPLIIHAVQHVLSAPVQLKEWPDEDRRTRLVFITNGIDPEPVRDLFETMINGISFPFMQTVQRLCGGVGASLSALFSQVAKHSRRMQ